MKSQRFPIHMIVSMLILVSMVGTLEARGWKKQSKAKSGVWMSEMDLTNEQMEKINGLRNEMQPAIMGIRQQKRTLEMQLNQLSLAQPDDQPKITKLQKAISANEQSIASLQKNHRAEIRALLTPEQQEVYDRYGTRSFSAKGGRKHSEKCAGNTRGQGRGKRG